MKKTVFVFFLFPLLAIFLSNCQPRVDIEAEKEAIMAVVQAESETARDGDVDKLISLYVQDELNTRLILRPDTFAIWNGWDELGPLFEQYGERNEEMDLSGINVSKENPVIKVMGNTAWLICDNNWYGEYQGEPFRQESLQITFLEKVDGEWKFSFAAWMNKPVPSDDDDEGDEEDDGGEGDEDEGGEDDD